MTDWRLLLYSTIDNTEATHHPSAYSIGVHPLSASAFQYHPAPTETDRD